jgi:hypothetical protein
VRKTACTGIEGSVATFRLISSTSGAITVKHIMVKHIVGNIQSLFPCGTRCDADEPCLAREEEMMAERARAREWRAMCEGNNISFLLHARVNISFNSGTNQPTNQPNGTTA